MAQSEQITEIYRHLPVAAQQEALDFLLFLHQRYAHAAQAEVVSKPKRSIRDNPGFGMWADLQGSSREYLSDIRREQWTHP